MHRCLGDWLIPYHPTDLIEDLQDYLHDTYSEGIMKHLDEEPSYFLDRLNEDGHAVIGGHIKWQEEV